MSTSSSSTPTKRRTRSTPSEDSIDQMALLESPSKKPRRIPNLIASTPLAGHSLYMPGSSCSVTDGDETGSEASDNAYPTDFAGVSLDGDFIDFDTEETDSISDGLGFDELSIKNKGRDYELFKPINQTHLYHKLVKDHTLMELYINEWYARFKQNDQHWKAITEILQLIIDVMGYQTVDVENIYTFNSNFRKPHPIIKVLEKTVIKKTRPQCLFVSNYLWAKKFREIFYYFLNSFFQFCLGKMILPEIQEHFSYLLKFAAKSDVLPIKHTALVIILKMSTTYARFMKEWAENTAKLHKTSRNIEVLFRQYFVFYLFTASREGNKRLECFPSLICAQEMKLWLKIAPEIVVEERGLFLKLLVLLLQDMDITVRKLALSTCLKIFSDEKYRPDMTLNCEPFVKLLENVVETATDVDPENSMLAIRCYTRSLQFFPNLYEYVKFPTDILKSLMANENYGVSKEAVLYYCAMIKLGALNNAEFLLKMIKLFSIYDYIETTTIITIVVECSLHEVKEFKDLDLMLNMLLSSDYDLSSSEKGFLMIILQNSVRQQYYGVSDIKRPGQPIDEVTEETKIEICTKILSKITELIGLYGQMKFFEYAIKILLLFPHTELLLAENSAFIKPLPDLLCKVFEKTTDEKILNVIPKFFSNCLKSDTFFKRLFKTTLNKYVEECILNKYEMIHDKELPTDPKEFLEQLRLQEELVQKLKNILKYIDITKLLSWDLIYSDWNLDRTAHKFIIIQMECCKFYLLRHLESVIKDESDCIQSMNTLKSQVKDFIQTCQRLFCSKTAKTVKHAAFLCLCTLHISYKTTLSPVFAVSNQKATALSLPRMTTCDKELCDYIAILITSQNLMEAKPLEFLNNLLNLIIVGGIPIANAKYILCNLNDDLNFKYEQLIMAFLTRISVNYNTISITIVDTIRYLFQDYKRTGDETKISQTIHRFSAFLIKSPTTSHLILRTILKSNELEMLKFCKTLIVCLKADQKEDLHTFIETHKTQYTGGLEEIIKQFDNLLQQNIGKHI